MINDLKDLKKLIQLCRSTGVESIKLGDIELHLGDKPTKAVSHQSEALQDPLAYAQVPEPNIYDPIAMSKVEAAKALKALQDEIYTPDAMTEEQQLMYSARSESFEGQQ